MRFPQLEMVFALLRAYCPGLKSNTAIGRVLAEKVGRDEPYDESTVRSWMRRSSKDPGDVPDEVGAALIDLVAEQIVDKRPCEQVIRMLESHAIHIHNALAPITARSWARFLSERLLLEPLGIQIVPPAGAVRPPRRTLRFGNQVGYKPPSPGAHSMGPHWLYRFSIQPPGGSNQGEAFVLEEKLAEWRFSHFIEAGRSKPVSGRPWWVPQQAGLTRQWLENDGSAGIFRHFVVAVDGLFDVAVRNAISCALPMHQMELDTLGEALLQMPAKAMVVGGTSTEVDPAFEPDPVTADH
jgi:hypothetical protein